MVNCSGTLSVNGESVYVEGSDTIRVIGEKKGLDKIFSDLKKFLRIEKDDVEINETENGNTTLTVTLNPESYKNKGQLKKQTGNSEDQSVTTTGTQAPSDKTGDSKRMQEITTVRTKISRKPMPVILQEKATITQTGLTTNLPESRTVKR